MEIGVPTEVLDQESRVGLTPAGVDALVHAGHQVTVQRGAGLGGFGDSSTRPWARLVDTAPGLERRDGVKVKEPRLKNTNHAVGQTLFTYLRLAASESLTDNCWHVASTPSAMRQCSDDGSLRCCILRARSPARWWCRSVRTI